MITRYLVTILHAIYYPHGGRGMGVALIISCLVSNPVLLRVIILKTMEGTCDHYKEPLIYIAELH